MSREVAPLGDIDPKVAAHAERFECYCGRELVVVDVAVCPCGKVPEECKCEELPDE